jgi:hypothetical protein
MPMTKQMEQSQDSETKTTSLDRRYGKIGIAAVAGAVGRKPEPRKSDERRYTHYESD